jgi:hypothetical protein
MKFLLFLLVGLSLCGCSHTNDIQTAAPPPDPSLFDPLPPPSNGTNR